MLGRVERPASWGGGGGAAPPAGRPGAGRPGALHSQATGAGVAHLAERDLPKVEVAGSSPVSRSSGFNRLIRSSSGAQSDLSASSGIGVKPASKAAGDGHHRAPHERGSNITIGILRPFAWRW